MTARILPFPSRGFARQQRDRCRKGTTPARHVVKVVGLDCAARQHEYALKSIRPGSAPPNLPIVPNLSNGSDRRCRGIEGQVLAFSPGAQRAVFDRLGHSHGSKLISYYLTRVSKGISGSIVSADILQFRRMGDDPNRIRELRAAAKLSQQALGDRVGCSKMTISDLERGNMELTLEYMRRIARALSVMPADLMPYSDNPDALDIDERRYLARYRKADSEQRETLDRVSEAVVPSDKAQKAA